MKVLIILFFLVNFIYASVAFISAFKGKAEIIRNGNIINVIVGIKVNNKDRIKTYEKTKLQLLFNDNTRITIGKNSTFSIEDYLYDESKPSKVKAKFRFSKGLFRTISGRIGKLNKNKFKIKVKSATIGIRGTEFDVLVTALETKISVSRGGVYFTQNNTIIDVKQNEFFIYDSRTNKVEVKEGIFEESKEFDSRRNEVKKTTVLKKEEKKEEKNKTVEKEKLKIVVKEVVEKKETEVKSLSEANVEVEVKVIDEIVDNIVDLEQNYSVLSEAQTDPQTSLPSNVSIINPNYNNKKEVMDTGYNDIPYLEYGYWQDPNQNNKRIDTFISGTTTPEQVIINNMNQTSNSAVYDGALSSIVTKADGTKVSSGGTINLNVDFSNQNFTGNINVDEGNWKASITSGMVNSTSLTSTSIVTNNGSLIDNITGDVNGNFYGTNANSIGGKFNLSSTNNGSVTGKFGAKND